MSGQPTDGRAESIRQRLRNELRSRGEDVTLGHPECPDEIQLLWYKDLAHDAVAG